MAASLYGVVTDGTDPIPDATVKLFDSYGAPYLHTMTDATGAYSFSGVPAGTYSVAAVQTGYPVSRPMGVTLAEGAATEINITCTADATLALGAIAGVLTVIAEGNPPLAGRVPVAGPDTGHRGVADGASLHRPAPDLGRDALLNTDQRPCPNGPGLCSTVAVAPTAVLWYNRRVTANILE